jgi:inhibitor of cysteine peptidase
LCAAALLACTVAGPAAAQDVNLRYENAGGKVALNANQTLVVHLPRNPSTGFRWALVEATNPLLKAEGLPAYEAPADLKKVGATGTEVWRLRPQRSGQQDLRFEYRRPWEKGKPERAIVYKVTVR